MRTYVLEQPGRFTATDTQAPGAPSAGEVRVRVTMVGICGTDLHAFEGTQPFFSYPRILGHELAVEILQTGEGVTNLAPGDQCAVNPYLACGECAACLRGRTNCCAKMRVIGVHSDGGMRDTILLPAKQLYKCAKLPPAMIPLVETLAVGIHAVNRASVQPGERAIVRGAGPIGLSVIEFLKQAGADIGVVEKIPSRLDYAVKKHSLTRYYPSHDEALRDGPSTIVFDCTGDKGSMDSAIHLLEQGGRLVFVGLINDHISIFDPDIHRREATIFASRNSTPAEHRRTLELMESGQVDVSSWPTDLIAPTLMQTRFPKWLNREDGIVKGVVNWS